jgi:hypothetical protein
LLHGGLRALREHLELVTTSRSATPNKTDLSFQLIAEGRVTRWVQHPASIKIRVSTAPGPPRRRLGRSDRAGAGQPTSTKARPIRSCGRGATTDAAAPPTLQAARAIRGLCQLWPAGTGTTCEDTPRSLVNTTVRWAPALSSSAAAPLAGRSMKTSYCPGMTRGVPATNGITMGGAGDVPAVRTRTLSRA